MREPEIRLETIYVHPLKSGAGNEVGEAVVAEEGLVGDRRYLVTTPDGTFVSARSHPAQVLVRSEIVSGGVLLRAPSMEDLFVPEGKLGRGLGSVLVWKDSFEALDCGEEAADWISRFHRETLRLIFLGESRRALRWNPERRLTFADAAPLLLIARESLDDVSRRSGMPLSARRFRPNLVVEGGGPFLEDSWRKIRIGTVDFLVLDACGRCELTTVDPDTGEKNPDQEPLATLRGFRGNDTGAYFGRNVMPLNVGAVRSGDPVTVLETSRPLSFGPFRLLVASCDPSWERDPTPLVCEAIEDEAQSAKTFRFRRVDGAKRSFDAGQYLNLVFFIGGKEVRRSYTISSSPASDDRWDVTVKRTEGGSVSNWMHDSLRPGDRVLCEGVGGRFTLTHSPWEKVLFLSAGSGITPMASMLRWIESERLPIDVVLHHSARRLEEVIFAAEIDHWRRSLGKSFQSFFSLTGQGSPLCEGAKNGRLDQAFLMEICPDLRERHVFVCGPVEYRRSVRTLLAKVGVKIDRRYHEEHFTEAEDESSPDSAQPGVVEFRPSGTVLTSDGRTTILRLAERAAIDLDSSCRSGECGSCRVLLKKGKVRELPSFGLSAEEKAEGWVLACSSLPEGDLTVELR